MPLRRSSMTMNCSCAPLVCDNGFAEAAMCVHVNGLDSLAVDHHWQALSAALLSPRRIPQPTTAENDAGRGAGTLEKIPARVHVRLPVDHFDRTSRTAGRHPQSRNFIRLPQQFKVSDTGATLPTTVPHVPMLEGPLRS